MNVSSRSSPDRVLEADARYSTLDRYSSVTKHEALT